MDVCQKDGGRKVDLSGRKRREVKEAKRWE